MSPSSSSSSSEPPRLPPTSDSDVESVDAGAAALASAPAGPRVRLLVSACLLGERVRYDGQHKRDAFVVETLGRFVEWVRVCPEVDCGMPVPRPSMHLVGDPASPRLVASSTGEDMTERMARFSRERLRSLEGLQLCGYVCKKSSPSSGMERVKVYDAAGRVRRVGAGMFTRAFLERFPLIPVEEDGRLHDPVLRESFIERVFALRRWYDLVAQSGRGRERGRLVEFHADHKMLLLAHGRVHYAALGRLVARAKELEPAELFERYHALFMTALMQRATVKKTSDVLLHMVGYFKKVLAPDEKRELLEVIDTYRRSLVPLVVPLTLLRHYVRKYDVEYLRRQTFLEPYPAELMLRNHC